MDAPWAWAIAGAVALQVLQTIQIAIVGRRVDTVAKSIMPPRPPPPLIAMKRDDSATKATPCVSCGKRLPRFELDDAGVCDDCRHDARPK